MEQEAREAGSVTRSQNVLYVMPHDWASIAQFLEPLVERIDAGAPDVQLLVVAPDSDVAAAIGAAAVKVIGERDLQIVAATSSARAARLLKIRPAQIVTGTPSTIVELLRSAAIKLDTVRAVCIAWADELLTRGDAPALETLMTEVPKDSARTVVTSELSAAVEEIVERYARRARKVITAANETDAPVAVEYVTVSQASRVATLRRVLDAVDPASALVFAREGSTRAEVSDLLRSIGYGSDGEVKVGLVAPPSPALVVLFDLPASRQELREASGGAARTIALVQPRQISSLRALAAGGLVKPFTLPESGQLARDADVRTRVELRAILSEGHVGRELLALEPLLGDYDGIEIAAAVLQLLERERQARQALANAAPAVARGSAPMVKLFVSVGARDNARASDLVGAIANQGGVSSAELGKVDVRESHSIVEVAPNVADTIIERVTGTTIKGRRAIVRRDEGVESRGGRPPRGDRPDRGERGERGAFRGERSERGARPGRGERGDRNERSDRGDRPPRRPRTEDRGE